MDPRVQEVEAGYLRTDLPAFAPGDTVRVRVRVVEGAKERIQAFEGVCIARRGAGLNETFMVRKISGGVGVERIFPIHSPALSGIEVVRRGQVRRAKLYYLRARRGKRARVRERRWWLDAKETSTAAPPADAIGEEDAADVADVAIDTDAGLDAEPAEANADASRE